MLCRKSVSEPRSEFKVSGFKFSIQTTPFFSQPWEKKSAPACHLVKCHIEKAKLSLRELKIVDSKLGDRKSSADSFWQVEPYNATADVLIFGVVSDKLKCLQRCVLSCAEQCPVEWDSEQATEVREALPQDTLHWSVFGRTGGTVTWFVCRVNVLRCSLKASRLLKASPFSN